MRNRVLIVEDNTDTARLMQKTLSTDYDVVVCHDAEDAARHLLSGLSDEPSGRKEFNVIICDVNLPGRDGLSLFEDMKLMGSGLDERFIFSSSAPAELIREKTGAAFLQKPFRFAELKSIVATQIRKQKPALQAVDINFDDIEI